MTPAPRPSQSDELAEAYVLLHRDSGAVLYPTHATAAEIYMANLNLRQAGSRHRYVLARLLPHGQEQVSG